MQSLYDKGDAFHLLTRSPYPSPCEQSLYKIVVAIKYGFNMKTSPPHVPKQPKSQCYEK